MQAHETSSQDVAQLIPLVMDDREPCEKMAAALAGCGCFSVEVRRLAAGDYLVDNALLIERKTLPDLVLSIAQGRLFRQALRLAEAELPAALILEGTTSDLNDSQMRREAIQGALVTVALFVGLPVLWSQHPHETARTLMYAARQRRAVVTDTLKRRGGRPKGKRALQSYILQGLPGVGSKRAEQLLQSFGCVEAVITASAEALSDVEGIGSETVRKIRWAVEEPADARSGCPAMLPGREDAYVDRTKIEGYLLSSAHPEGGGKAAFFSGHGFRLGRWVELAMALREVGISNPVASSVQSPYGVRYVVDGALSCPDGRAPVVRTVWILEAGQDSPRLVTAYPYPQQVDGHGDQ